MDLSLTEEQTLLKGAIERFLENRYDFETRRKILETPEGWSPEIWQALAIELGILGILAPAETGGFEGEGTEILLLAEALGRALVIEPVIESAVIGINILKRAKNDTTVSVLEGIVSGMARTAFAWTEPTSRNAPNNVSTTAKFVGNEWVLDGTKTVVFGLPQASHILVTARTEGRQHDTNGVSLFLVENKRDFLKRHDYRTIDDRQASDVVFNNLRLPAEVQIADLHGALPLIKTVLDEATVAVCSDAIGAMSRLLEDTIDYTKQRQQFGVPIGKFQALQHKMVDMYMELELARSATMRAALNLGNQEKERARTVSIAKKTVNDAARFIGQTAVQLHGAMGMTEELAVGHIFKRLTAAENTLGSADYHTERFRKFLHSAA